MLFVVILRKTRRWPFQQRSCEITGSGVFQVARNWPFAHKVYISLVGSLSVFFSCHECPPHFTGSPAWYVFFSILYSSKLAWSLITPPARRWPVYSRSLHHFQQNVYLRVRCPVCILMDLYYHTTWTLCWSFSIRQMSEHGAAGTSRRGFFGRLAASWPMEGSIFSNNDTVLLTKFNFFAVFQSLRCQSYRNDEMGIVWCSIMQGEN